MSVVLEWLLGPKANRLHRGVFSIIDKFDRQLKQIDRENQKLNVKRDKINTELGLLESSKRLCEKFIAFARDEE